MKILMLTWEYPPRVVGGISRVVYDLSRTLLKDGHDVTVVTYKEGDAPEFEDDKGVKVYRVNNYMINPNNFIDWIMQLNFNLVAKANEIIAKEGKFDVIHAHDWLVAYAAKTLKNSYNIPIVSTIHATEAGRNSGIHDETQRYINDTEWMLTYESSEVIVNSNYMKNELQRLFGLPYEKINVIPNGVNMNLFNGIERDYNFRRKFAMDNENIEIETNPFPIMPLLARFDSGTSDLYILDTSALFYNENDSKKQYTICDEPEISIHNAIESYLVSKINNTKINIKKINPSNFEYMTAIIENMTHCVEFNFESRVPFSKVNIIKYTVLYHEDATDIENIYQNMTHHVPILKNVDFQYKEWFDFISEMTESKTQ